ncbi:hypothetical protein WN943_024115 [Citrus x changshan-huyou]
MNDRHHIIQSPSFRTAISERGALIVGDPLQQQTLLPSQKSKMMSASGNGDPTRMKQNDHMFTTRTICIHGKIIFTVNLIELWAS